MRLKYLNTKGLTRFLRRFQAIGTILEDKWEMWVTVFTSVPRFGIRGGSSRSILFVSKINQLVSMS